MRQLFGTDGIRGIPGEFPLDDATVFAFGRAVGELVRAEGGGRVLLGMDTRESSPRLAALVAAGLATQAVVAVSAGVVPTAAVAILVQRLGFDAGVMISASHNPYPDNGLKLFSRAGQKFSDQVEARLEARLRALRTEPPRQWELPEPQPELAECYLETLCRRAMVGPCWDQLTLVLDCAHGAASRLAPELFRRLGARVIALHCQPDGRNINTACGSLHPATLQERVRAEGAALGVAFDGDADRAIFATASGRLVDGDGVLYLAAERMSRAGLLRGGVVVGTLMSNFGLEQALARHGLGLVRVPVGDRYVLEEMQRRGANLGGEPSGHVIFLDESPTGDGLLTALRVAGWVLEAGSLERLVHGLSLYPQRLINLPVAAKPPLESLPGLCAEIRQAETALRGRGRILVRYSGTEPVVRVMVEAEQEAEAKYWAARLAEAVRAALGCAPSPSA